MTTPQSLRSATRPPSLGGRLTRLARRAWHMEVGVWLSLWRFITRRPRVPAGATAFTYHRPVSMILIVFLVLSAIEIPIVDLIVHPWPWIRIPLLIAGIWGVTWMLGLLLGFLTRPHAVGPEGIRARVGTDIDLDLRWHDVASVERAHDVAEKTASVRHEASGPVIALRMQDETNVLVTLERRIPIRTPTAEQR